MKPSPPAGKRSSPAGSLLTLTLLLSSGCAGTAAVPHSPDDSRRCVVGVEEQMRLVTFAPESGLDGGVTSVFFDQIPSVEPGDLVRLKPGPAGGVPHVETIGRKDPSCSEVARAAAEHHHGQH